MKLTRREMLAAAATAMAAAATAFAAKPQAATTSTTRSAATTRAATTQAATTQANARPRVGIIGCGGIANFHAVFIKPHADIVAVCDVDKEHLNKFNDKNAGGTAFLAADYRDVISRKDVDLIWVCTPDHWHTKIAVDAMRAGKDVYLEKPATLTFDEGRVLCRVTRETARVVQVGTQQRQDEKFLTAIALVHAGRLGKIKRVTIAIGKTPDGADLKTSAPPPELDWNAWLGQAPKVPYIKQRCHYNFRWWYEYSGGRMTDWGAHHVDIAQWAAAPDLPGPLWVQPMQVKLPVRMKNGFPTRDNAYNTAQEFTVKCTFANGVEFLIRDRAEGIEREGILFEGERASCYVSREKLSGSAVDALKDNPLPNHPLLMSPVNKSIEQPHERHIAEFIACARDRTMPRSDVWSHHRVLTTCHLANIAMRLNRRLKWDATAEAFVGDAQANSLLSREQRKGFEVV